MADFRADINEPLAMIGAITQPETNDTSSENVTSSPANDTSTDLTNGTGAPGDSSSSEETDDTGTPSEDTGEAPSSTPTSSPPAAPSSTDVPSAPIVDHLVIAAVQIAGAAADNDFVEIYNPTPGTVDMSGWKLRKKSSTGTDSSLREFPKGSAIAPGGYFTWASSVNGFAASIGADVSSTGTLAANNSVALQDGAGAQVDAVAWGTGTNQYAEGAAYPDDPTANQILSRKFSDGVVVDTDNNNEDFSL
jgi:hypothetical protein